MINMYPYCAGVLLAFLCSSTVFLFASDSSQSAAADSLNADAKPRGISQRTPWTTSRIVGSPEPPAPFLLERAFPKLQFKEPVDLCPAPGSDRLFVMELGGKIFSFRNDDSSESPDLLFDIKAAVPGAQSAYGMIFHPGFETNRYVFLCYVLKEDLPEGSRVSRFTVTRSDPPRIEPASEQIMITWRSGGHNGGALKFGPDGYLYISTGDAAGPNPPDPLKTGQDNTDLLSCVLRIDVDRQDPGKAYRVPPDNPFVNLTGTRPEIWAYGFRNPWRMSFDRQTGELWLGDVGWELWELVFKIERGGNYGWSIVEGPQSIHPNLEKGPTPILAPIKAHPHSEAASITGGFVYRGSRLSELTGAYIYGDWVTGKIWALRAQKEAPPEVRELVDSAVQIIAFGEEHSGELLVMDYAGALHRLARNPAANTAGQFPRRLSETGLFSSTEDHTPARGVLPFLINAEMWSDYALAERFIGLPEYSRIQTGATNVWLYQSKNEWRYPTNAVLAKTLFLKLDRGNAASLRRVETQVLHYDGLDWRAYSYRWNDEQTDATLVSADGDQQELTIADPSGPGGKRDYTWRFHSRAECLRCHNPWVNYALAFTAPQLNREVQYHADRPVSGSTPILMKPSPWPNEATYAANQLRVLSHIGFFDQRMDERARPRFSDPYSAAEKADLNERARSWLHVNCAHCHREGAGGSVVTHFDYDTKLKDMKAVGRPPSQGHFGIGNAHVITSGRAEESVLYYRILTTGQGRMPLIGSRLVDTQGVNLIYDWIRQLPRLLEGRETQREQLKIAQAPLPAPSLDEAKLAPNAGDAEHSDLLKTAESLFSAALSRTDRERIVNELLDSTSGALALATALNRRTTVPHGIMGALLPAVENHPEFTIRDLFERYLPEEKRIKKLGTGFDPAIVLSLKGDPGRGQRIFAQEGGCIQCHRMGGEGRELGPDLSQIGKKYDRAQLLDHILNPSKVIDEAYVNYVVETADELSYSGIILKRTLEELVLKDANALEVKIPQSRIKSVQAQKLSAMPEGLIQNLTAPAAADLLEFLSGLREGE